MRRPLRSTLLQSVVAAVFFSAPLAAQTPPPAAAPPKPEAAKPEAPKGPATYVGSQTCQLCHEEIFSKFSKNAHHLLETDKKRGWEGNTCEACHGPGSIHAESVDPKDIRNPAKLAPAAQDRLCLICHLNTTAHAGRISNAHPKNGVSCLSCHAMHQSPEELVTHKPAAINEKCASCHVSVWASFQRPYRHKLPESAMSCVDCHDPHGRPVTTQARAVIDNKAGCFQCHGDKRGPTLYEHEPMRTDGCMACHEPHGSANPRMLTRNEVRVVCLECHANIGSPNPALGGVPPAFHDLRSPRYQSCVTCHVKVHGSNVDRNFLR
jgi:DmsE family decaheme c-type cytochrome